MKTTQFFHNDPIFSSTFPLLYLFVTFLNLKILKIHFQVHYFGPFWSVKYLNFSPKVTGSDGSS